MDRPLRRAGYEEHRFDAGGVTLNYAVGPEAGPPLVLIPGQTMPWQSYTRVLPALAKRFHVHAVDVRGHGASDWTPGEYTFVSISTDIADLIDGVIGRPAMISGNSSGGVIAVWIAANRPGCAAAIIPEDPPLFSAEEGRIQDTYVYRVMKDSLDTLAGPGERDIPEFLRRLRIPSERRTKIAAIPRPLVAILALYLGATRWMRPDEVPDLTLMPFPVRMLVRGFGSYDPEFTRAFLDGTAGEGFDHAETLPRVACPTLLLHCNWFHHEQFGLVGAMSDEDATRVQALVPQIDYVSIPGGHVVHQENPERFVQEIVGFAEHVGVLESVPPTAPSQV